MKTELQKHLATIAPSVSIVTIWEHDPDHCDIRKDCDGFDDENPEDWEAWQSEIRATAICGGEEITGSAYLGGTWEKYGDDPRVSNPEISGYELQMTVEALRELLENTGGMSAPPQLFAEVSAALDWLKAESGRRYEMERAKVEIDNLLKAPRCKSCTEMSNVALCHAVDAASFRPSPETLARLIREIEDDKQWNPGHWKPATI